MTRNLQQLKLGFFVKTKGVFSKPLYAGLGHILVFHRVLPHSSRDRIAANAGLETSPEKLEWIIQYFLKHGYEVISMDDLVGILMNKQRPKKKFIVITFDDGYIDNYTYAYPLLKKSGHPFTVYVTTDYSAGKAVMWWYFLEEYILKNDSISWQGNIENTEFRARTRDEKEKLFHKLRMQLINGGEGYMRSVLSNNIGITDERIKAFCLENSMSAGQIKEMSDDPLVTIGAHTISHKPLSKLDDDEAMNEIASSKMILEEITGKLVTHFAYPYGSPNEYGARELYLTEKAGFITSVTVQQGNIFYGYSGHMQHLPRIPLGEKTTGEVIENIMKGIRHYSFNGSKKII